MYTNGKELLFLTKNPFLSRDFLIKQFSEKEI